MNDNGRSRCLGRRALLAGFLLPRISWIFQDSTLQSIFCLFSSFLYLLWSDCFHNKKQRRLIACSRPHTAGLDTGKSCTVGGICFPEHLSLLCSGRCPRTTHLGLHLPRRARGPGSFVSPVEIRGHSPGQPKCHCISLFTQLRAAHSELFALCKG